MVNKDSWLYEQIQQAKKEVASWPTWMKKDKYKVRFTISGPGVIEVNPEDLIKSDEFKRQLDAARRYGMDLTTRAVVQQFKARAKQGVQKYGTTLDREDLSFYDWLQHLQEELMDATLYIQKLKQEHEVIHPNEPS